MSFILRWTNPNKQATTINIYRDTKTLVIGSLPAPIATLTQGETQWRDTTAVKGQTYYYMMSVTANNKTVYATQQSYTVAVKRGIGGSAILWGNDELGFMGTVPYTEQMDQSQFPAAFQSIITTAFTDRCPMLKFSYQGRILYVFDRLGGFIANVPWSTLYTGGLVYGRDDNGPDGSWGSLTPTPQDAKILHNNDVYRLRCPRGMVAQGQPLMFPFDQKMDRVNHDKIVPALGYNEYNDIVMSSHLGFPNNRRTGATRSIAASNLGNINTASSSSIFGAGVACQERDTLTQEVLLRGLFYTNAAETTTDTMQKINFASMSQTARYFPIIELVE